MAIRFRALLAMTAVMPVVLASSASASTRAASQQPGPVVLSETGSTLLYPLFGTWAAAYHAQHPTVALTRASTGSGVGITAASNGRAAIGGSDAFLSAGNLVQDTRLLNIPLAISAQQVNYNLPSLGAGVHLKLDGPVLAQMYSGQITSWRSPQIQALNPGISGAIYGTVGYQAPEIADAGPSPASDLYTVGRTLAVLSFEFAGYQSTYAHSLPDPATVPVLAENESFLRALRRATDPDPARRFASAGEMAEQLTGVLREVLALADRQPRPAFSTLFSPELQATGVPPIAADDGADRTAPGGALPPPRAEATTAGLSVPQVDPADPAAGYLAALGTAEPAQLTAVLETAVAGAQGTPQAVAESTETLLALTRARIVTGDLAGAWKSLGGLAAQQPDDWRVTWYRGLAELAACNPAAARSSFDAICDMLPGEPAPKLALAFAAEAAGDAAAAARYFGLVWTLDRSFVSAAFGLARWLQRSGDRAGAVAALASVPPTSSYFLADQVAAVRIRVSPPPGQPCAGADELAAAGRDLGRIALEPASAHQITAEVLRAALDRLLASQPLDSGELLGCQTTERSLRFGLERSYRAQARLAGDRLRRVELVDAANAVRLSTWS